MLPRFFWGLVERALEADDKDGEGALHAPLVEYPMKASHSAQVFERMSQGVWQVDSAGTTIFVNERMSAMVGHTREEFVARPSLSFFGEEVRGWIAAGIASRRSGVGDEYECRLAHKDGSWVSVFVEVAPLYREDGEFDGTLALVSDLSDRKRAEESLHESDARYRRLVETIPGILYTYSDEQGGSYYSPQVEKVLGYSAEHFLEHPTLWHDSIHPDDVPSVDQALREQSADVSEIEYRIKDAGQSWRWLLDRFVRIPRAGGGSIIEGLAIDITTRKQAEDEVRALSRAVEQSPLSIVITDRAGTIEYVNPYFERSTGYTKAEVLGNNTRVLKSGTMPAETYVDMWALISEGGEWRGELCNRRKNGELFWESAAISGIRNGEGDVSHYIAVKDDITDRKRAEAALEQSQDLLVNLARVVPGVIYQYRLYPDGRSAFPYSSPGMSDIYEVTPEDVREDATPVFGRLHPEDFDHVANAIEASARTLTTFYCEFRVVLPRQGLRWRWSQAQPERTADGGTLWHGVILDVTDRKLAEVEKAKLEAQFQQALKMESVGRLAGGIAHDFNNMLAVILSYADLAADHVAERHPLRSDLEAITDAARRSADLTRQLLSFSRQQPISPRVVDLNACIQTMLKMLDRLVGENVQVVFLSEEKLWAVMIDPSQVDQILANLCVNARDAIADIGTLTVQTSNVTLDEGDCTSHAGCSPGEYVRLAVSDDGCGIGAAALPHVFEPFFTTKALGSGTGLGLATVYAVVQQNGGSIDVHSEVGRGTTFTIHLPRHADVGRLHPREEQRSQIPCGDETILVVEDEAVILRATTRLLEGLGYTVLGANSPGDAMRLAQEFVGPIHLVMTDVIMPEMNGRDLAKHLTSSRPGLEVVFMSGFTSNVIAVNGVLHEGVKFLQKPFSRHDLGNKVREALDGGSRSLSMKRQARPGGGDPGVDGQ